MGALPRPGAGPRRAGLIGVLTAEAVSQVGTKMTFVAIPWLVLLDTGSPTMMGLVAAAEMVPYMLAGVLGAPLVDRLGSWRSAIDTDLLSALTLMAVVLSYRQLGMVSLTVLVFIAGGLRGVSHPARTVLLRPMIDAAGANVTRVTAIYDGIGRLTTLIGAPVGGLLLAWLSPLSVMAVDAATFALAALIVAAFVRMPAVVATTTAATGPTTPPAASATTTAPANAAAIDQPAVRQPAAESYLDSLRGGVEYLRRDRLILGVLLLLFIGNLATQAHQVVFIPLWVSERLGTPAGLGLVFGTFALGAVIGNLVFTAIAPRLPRYLTLTIGYLVGGAPRILVLAFTDSLPVVMAVLFISGVALSAVNPIIGAVLYQRVPASLQARVFGLASAFASAGLPIGSLLGGWIAQTMSLTVGLVVFGVVLFAATLTPVLGNRTWRELDDQSAAPADSGSGTRLPAPLTITLAYARGEWRLAAQRGRRALGPSQAIEPAEALRKVALLELPEALAAAEAILEAERSDALREAERLRCELAEVEGRLAALRHPPRHPLGDPLSPQIWPPQNTGAAPPATPAQTAKLTGAKTDSVPAG